MRDILYRTALNIPSDYTFGIEIEFVGALINEIEKSIKKEWEVTSEVDITRINDKGLVVGGEIISPVLKDETKTWKYIKEVCELIIKLDGKVSNNCGGHVHVGGNILNSEKIKAMNFIKNWVVFEDVIYRFFCGEKLKRRVFENGLPITRMSKRYMYSDMEDKLLILLNKEYGVNMTNFSLSGYSNSTVEIRCPDGTLDYIRWQNNINFIMKFMLYCSKITDLERLDYEFDNISIDYEITKLNEMKALILCDKIFTDNLDKENFMKQYIR